MPELDKALTEVKKGEVSFYERTELSGADMEKKMEL